MTNLTLLFGAILLSFIASILTMVAISLTETKSSDDNFPINEIVFDTTGESWVILKEDNNDEYVLTNGKVTYVERKVYDYSQVPVWQATLEDIIALHEFRRQIEEVAKTGGRISGIEINKLQAETKEYLTIKQP